MQNSVTPFLMFQGKAEEALNLYVSLIPNSKIVDIQRYGPQGPGAPGSVMMARGVIGGLPVIFNDSNVVHSFTFTPSTSLFVACASEQELDRIAEALADEGQFLMPIDNYGFSRRFAWLNDRYGVSWQLNLE